MKNAILLDRAILKSIAGGSQQNVCAGKTGVDLQNCIYNSCMSGWNSAEHEDKENNNKIETCYAAAGF